MIGNSCPGVSAFICLKVGISTSSSSLTSLGTVGQIAKEATTSTTTPGHYAMQQKTCLGAVGHVAKEATTSGHYAMQQKTAKVALVQWGTLQLKKTTPPAGTIAGSPGHIGYWMSHLEPSLFAWKFCFIFIFQVLLNQRYQYNRISQTFHGRPGDSILEIYY